MPPATGLPRGQAVHYSRQRFEMRASLPAQAAFSICKGLYRPSNLTPRITRRPKPLLLMTACVSAVACMRLLGRSSAPPRNALSLGAALSSDLTPGITRRPKPFAEHEIHRVGGRVHAVVMLRRGVIIQGNLIRSCRQTQ